MKWTPDLATNIDLIDTQHQEIIRRMDDAVRAGKSGNEEDIRMTLWLLSDFCATHFSCEENLQLKGKYNEYRKHCGFHKTFLATVKKLTDKLDTEGPTKELTQEISNVVGQWLKVHIMQVDKKLGGFLEREAPELKHVLG